MKKSLLVLTAVLLASTSAFAENLYHPFYMPKKGGILSDTNVIYQKAKKTLMVKPNGKDAKIKNVLLSEGITFGLTNNLAVTGTVADAWYLNTPGTKGHDRFDNPAFAVGMKYNLFDSKKSRINVQFGADYTQGTLSMNHMMNEVWHWYDHHHVKSISGYVKAGFEIQDGFLPYVTGTAVKPVGKNESKSWYVGRAGVYKTLTANLAGDVGINYLYSTTTYAHSKHFNASALDASLNYRLSKNSTVGLTGSYMLSNRPVDYDYYTIGLNYKASF